MWHLMERGYTEFMGFLEGETEDMVLTADPTRIVGYDSREDLEELVSREIARLPYLENATIVRVEKLDDGKLYYCVPFGDEELPVDSGWYSSVKGRPLHYRNGCACDVRDWTRATFCDTEAELDKLRKEASVPFSAKCRLVTIDGLPYECRPVKTIKQRARSRYYNMKKWASQFIAPKPE